MILLHLIFVQGNNNNSNNINNNGGKGNGEPDKQVTIYVMKQNE